MSEDRSVIEMICDRIIFGGQILLTIYHQGLDNEINNRRLNIVEKVGRYNLIFTETIISDAEIEDIVGWSAKESGLLTPESTKNPYSGGTCAYMVHYQYYNKPSLLFRFMKDKYVLKIPIEKLIQINSFIKKYTGFDIEKNPMFYGDVLLLKSYSKNYYAKNSDGIILKNVPIGSTVIVRFKKDEVIVLTKVVRISDENLETEIKSDKLWTFCDIEIFFNDELMYYEKDVSFARSIKLKMQIQDSGKRIRLNKIANNFTIKGNAGSHVTNIGELPDEFEEIMHASANEVKHRLNAEKTDEQVIFMKPKELKKAVNLIGDIMQEALDTIWIFDSYFTDINDINGMLDWIRILANCRAQTKNVVFYCKNLDNALDIEKLKNEIENDIELSVMLRDKNKIGVHFYQTRSPIHDRFVLTETNNTNAGLAMGTSFNSLDDHYYCIYKLSHKTSQLIWEELEEWMHKGNNLIKDEEM